MTGRKWEMDMGMDGQDGRAWCRECREDDPMEGTTPGNEEGPCRHPAGVPGARSPAQIRRTVVAVAAMADGSGGGKGSCVEAGRARESTGKVRTAVRTGGVAESTRGGGVENAGFSEA